MLFGICQLLFAICYLCPRRTQICLRRILVSLRRTQMRLLMMLMTFNGDEDEPLAKMRSAGAPHSVVRKLLVASAHNPAVAGAAKAVTECVISRPMRNTQVGAAVRALEDLPRGGQRLRAHCLWRARPLATDLTHCDCAERHEHHQQAHLGSTQAYQDSTQAHLGSTQAHLVSKMTRPMTMRILMTMTMSMTYLPVVAYLPRLA